MSQDFLRLLCFTLLLALTGSHIALAVTPADSQLWITNGPVNTMSTNDDVSHLFVSGQFSYSDPGTGAMAINAQSGVFDSSFPSINGPVFALVSDTAGGWYLGGQFTMVGGLSRNNLAHVEWDSASGWSIDAWAPEPNAAVYALALSSDAGTLYVGGAYTGLDGGAVVRRYLAAVSTTLSASANDWVPALDNTVRTLVLSADDGTLYVGGDFTHVEDGTVTRNCAAAFDVAELDTSNDPNPNFGTVLTWNPDANASVYAMTLAGSRLYLGGAFTELNGGAVQRSYVAAVGLSAADVDAAWNPGPDQTVRALAVADSRVYLGGDFGTINGGSNSQPYLAAVDNSAGLIDGNWRPGLDAAVYSLLASTTGDLYVGGDFNHINGQQRNRLAMLGLLTAALGDWQPSSWTRVHALGGSGSFVLSGGGFDRDSRSLLYIGGDFDYVGPATGSGVVLDGNGQVDTNLPQIDGSVYTVISDGFGGWYLGGDFDSVGGVARTNLAHIDSSSNLSGWNPVADGPVYALVLSTSGSLYAGGAFASINGNTRPYLAEMATVDGSLTTWDPQATGIVRTLVLSGTTLYIGGDFFSADGVVPSIGGSARDYLAALSTIDGTAITTWDADGDGPVYSVIPSSASTLYVGGAFTTLNGGMNHPYLAEVTMVDGSLTTWDPQATDFVRALALSGTTLYVGGDFFSADGSTPSIGRQPRNYLAALNTVTGDALTVWQADANAPVHALYLMPGQVYVGGEFTLIDGISRNRLALLAAADGQPADWNPSVGGTVYTIVEQTGSLFVGGGFASVGGVPRRHLAALDLLSGQAEDWNPGVDGSVRTLLISGSTVYIGGEFTMAGGQFRRNLAAIDKTTGAATSWAPEPDGVVYALSSTGNNFTLFVAGSFAQIGAVDRNGLAEVGINGTTTTWDPGLDSGAEVYTLMLSGSALYVGGVFTITDITSTVLSRNVAAVNAESAALSLWRPTINDAVRAVRVSADAANVYIGGDFTLVDGQSRLHVAALDAQAQNSGEYTLGWTANTGDPSGSVRALALSRDQTTLFIAGDFSAIAGDARSGIAAIRIVDNVLNNDWSITTDTGVDTVIVNQDAVYAGGRFLTLNGMPRTHLAAFDALPAETDPPVTSVSLPAGSYTAETLEPIELSCDDGLGSGCAAIYYAIDDDAWTLYSGPITLKQDTVLHYFSVDNVGNSEDITANQADYILEITAPVTTISPSTGVYATETRKLTLTCVDDQSGCAATYYTLDDSTPTVNSHRYAGPFTISGRTIVKFFSVDQVGNREDVRRSSYVSSFGGGSGRIGSLLLSLMFGAAIVRIVGSDRRGSADA